MIEPKLGQVWARGKSIRVVVAVDPPEPNNPDKRRMVMFPGGTHEKARIMECVSLPTWHKWAAKAHVVSYFGVTDSGGLGVCI